MTTMTGHDYRLFGLTFRDGPETEVVERWDGAMISVEVERIAEAFVEVTPAEAAAAQPQSESRDEWITAATEKAWLMLGCVPAALHGVKEIRATDPEWKAPRHQLLRGAALREWQPPGKPLTRDV